MAYTKKTTAPKANTQKLEKKEYAPQFIIGVGKTYELKEYTKNTFFCKKQELCDYLVDNAETIGEYITFATLIKK